MRNRDADAALLEALLKEAPFGVALIDRDLRYVRISERLAEINGVPAEAHVGRRVSELIPDAPEEIEELLRRAMESSRGIRGLEAELPGRSPSGGRAFRVDFVPVRDAGGEVSGLVAIVADITDTRRRAAEVQRLVDELSELALTDALTGLPNRRAWAEALSAELARQRRQKSRLCVALLDIDEFKRFNDEHGHEHGDRVLRETAEKWRAELREGDVLARYGGEEFAALLPGSELAGARALIDRVRAASRVSASAGVTVTRRGDTVDSVMRRVDEALYEAKRAGRNRTVAF